MKVQEALDSWNESAIPKDELEREAHEIVKNALEKQVVKQPHTCGSYCSICGTIVLGTANPMKKYCEFCGQRLYD